MKKFYEPWTQEEIDEYLARDKKVLVLFEIHLSTKEARVMVHGNLKDSQKALLKVCIANEFGGKSMSEDLVGQINDYAENWYYRYIERAPIRLINLGKRKK